MRPRIDERRRHRFSSFRDAARRHGNILTRRSHARVRAALFRVNLDVIARLAVRSGSRSDEIHLVRKRGRAFQFPDVRFGQLHLFQYIVQEFAGEYSIVRNIGMIRW
ncbi:hypothetical protein [Psittacid alphaherpesvirus 5]|uniref:Uncharacterized protein n=1 Tax=Psittacid alphaherpesvirus 5 TaxID=2972693 RepID=A0A5P9JPB2_9ALPH|nr:hypothetical protein QKU09_gp63 [Psittacid alphaherpesvirus 5]QFU14607.1 hypothetical protein [Psittacid alphaherpesvirus 5]UOO01078.1 hypothetical protein [Psittacid alphaherpesvirus 5]